MCLNPLFVHQKSPIPLFRLEYWMKHIPWTKTMRNTFKNHHKRPQTYQYYGVWQHAAQALQVAGAPEMGATPSDEIHFYYLPGAQRIYLAWQITCIAYRSPKCRWSQTLCYVFCQKRYLWLRCTPAKLSFLDQSARFRSLSRPFEWTKFSNGRREGWGLAQLRLFFEPVYIASTLQMAAAFSTYATSHQLAQC